MSVVQNIISAISIAEERSYWDASRVFYDEIGVEVLSHPSFAECFVDPHAFYSGIRPSPPIGDPSYMESAFHEYLNTWDESSTTQLMKYLEEWSNLRRPTGPSSLLKVEVEENKDGGDGGDTKSPRKNAPKNDSSGAGAEEGEDDEVEDLGEEEEDEEDADYKSGGSDEGEEGEEGDGEEGEDDGSDEGEAEDEEGEEEEEEDESDEEDEKTKKAADKGKGGPAKVAEEPVTSSGSGNGNTLKKKASKEEAEGSPIGKKRRVK